MDGVNVIDLHDSKYDSCWKKFGQGWEISGKDMSIQDCFYDMYNKKPEERTHFSI
ncbi:hypothetical protein [Wolbachia pipientis]|uniref:hypothetical protein n=1 Tax=Wolbachia pipientis TaxID=955 RepID=UPI0025A3698F|nr:hypothetical protein [Wolbachia pipientis]MDM8335259.1 hypothetical protein [Wolbachia pipientis]